MLTVPSSSYALVASPRYQMLPPESWAYQSKVSSTSSPSERATSWTIRARMPSIILVRFNTLTRIVSTSLPSVSR